MKVGIGLPNTIPGTDGSLLVEWARRADDGPFSAVAVLDRLVYDSIEPFAALSAAAAVTERVRLATMIAIGPLRGTAMLAKQAVSVDSLAGGRFTLGLGVGARRDDYAVAGVNHRTRGATLSEQLAYLRGELDGSGVGPARPPRKAEDELERAVLHIAASLRRRTTMDTLSYAGGVALNCTTNRRLREAGWRDVYVHPAATDDGNAIGLALYGWIEALGNPRQATKIFNPFTGINYSGESIRGALTAFGLDAFAMEVSAAEAGADRIARGDVVCWFQGESEWGPRALGARSIIASPLIPGMRDRINGAIKYREAFRPFGISGTAEGLAELVETDSVPASLAPYMLAVGPLKDDRLSEVRHADGIVRYQVVDADVQPIWHQLIEAFGRRTGVFAIINTSFNTLGEPLVETPMDALRQFLVSDADALIMETTLLVSADVSMPVLEEARAKAWAMMAIAPLSAAMGLATAGYVEAAVNLLDRKEYTEDSAKAEGVEALQHYHGLRHRAARQRGDLDAARHHAESVLRWASLSPDAVQAAAFMAEDPSVNDGRRMAGRLIGGLGRPGAALDFFTNLLDKPVVVPAPRFPG